MASKAFNVSRAAHQLHTWSVPPNERLESLCLNDMYEKVCRTLLRPVSAAQQMVNATPEQAKARHGCLDDLGEKGWPGNCGSLRPLGNGKSLKADSVSNTRTTVVGYSIVGADSMEAVTTLLGDHPHLRMPRLLD